MNVDLGSLTYGALYIVGVIVIAILAFLLGKCMREDNSNV